MVAPTVAPTETCGCIRDAQFALGLTKYRKRPQRTTRDRKVEVCGSTRTRGYGSGTGTKSTGTGIPVFTRKERHFSRCWSYIECFLFLPFKNITYDKS